MSEPTWPAGPPRGGTDRPPVARAPAAVVPPAPDLTAPPERSWAPAAAGGSGAGPPARRSDDTAGRQAGITGIFSFGTQAVRTTWLGQASLIGLSFAPGLLALLAAWALLPPGASADWLDRGVVPSGPPVVAAVAAIVLFVLGRVVLVGASMRLVLDTAQGRDPSVARALAGGLRAAPQLVAVGVVLALVVAAPWWPVVDAVAPLGAVTGSGIEFETVVVRVLAALLASLVLAVPALFLWWLTAAAVAAGGGRGEPAWLGEALRRVWEVLRAGFWRLFGWGLFIGGVVLGASWAVGSPLSVLSVGGEAAIVIAVVAQLAVGVLLTVLRGFGALGMFGAARARAGIGDDTPWW